MKILSYHYPQVLTSSNYLISFTAGKLQEWSFIIKPNNDEKKARKRKEKKKNNKMPTGTGFPPSIHEIICLEIQEYLYQC